MTYIILISGFDGLGKTTLRKNLTARLESLGASVYGCSTSDPIAADLEPVFGPRVWHRPLDKNIRGAFCAYADYKRESDNTYFMRANLLKCHRSGADFAIIDGVRFRDELPVFNADTHIHIIRPDDMTEPTHAGAYWGEEPYLSDAADIKLKPFPCMAVVKALSHVIIDNQLYGVDIS